MLTIWIVRKGSGRAQVYPSPCVVQSDRDVTVKNWTDCPAEVHLPRFPAHVRAVFTIAPGGEESFSLAGAPGGYHEYGISLTCERGAQYVEGGSKPSIIIDP